MLGHCFLKHVQGIINLLFGNNKWQRKSRHSSACWSQQGPLLHGIANKLSCSGPSIFLHLSSPHPQALPRVEGCLAATASKPCLVKHFGGDHLLPRLEPLPTRCCTQVGCRHVLMHDHPVQRWQPHHLVPSWLQSACLHPRPLPAQRRLAQHPSSHSCPCNAPERPMWACTSSQMRSTPCSSHKPLAVWRNSLAPGAMPPSPCRAPPQLLQPLACSPPSLAADELISFTLQSSQP